MTDELKPLLECPFCGSDKVDCEYYVAENAAWCYECKAKICTQDCPIKAWNKRTPDPRLEKALAFIKAMSELSPTELYYPAKIYEARELLKELDHDKGI